MVSNNYNGGICNMDIKAEIIAEIGINHRGNMALATLMVEEAKKCGANVAKFQLYDPVKLLHQKDFTKQDWIEIMKSQLSFGQTILLKRHCDKIGIEFMASAFDLERLEWLELLNVKRHKIASRSVYDRDYCQAVIKTGKPYLVSDGGIKPNNVLNESLKQTNRRLRIGKHKCSFLYCVSSYPTDLKKVYLHKQMFNVNEIYNGFSDHTVGITASITALAYGAKIVEKHFTIDKTLPGPDQRGSIISKELQFLCNYRDELHQMEKKCDFSKH